jgi:mono/diheme cytochrome c family protein
MTRQLGGVIAAWVALLLAAHAPAFQSGTTAPLTGNPAIDEWIRTTFGQPVDPETLSDPVWGTKTLLSLTDSEREGARLFMQRCNVCHGAGMNAVVAYGPLLSRKNVVGREDDVRKIIRDGTPRMPAFRHALQPLQIDMIVDYLKRVDKYEPVY